MENNNQEQNQKKKKRQPSVHERRLYNAYARKMALAGKDPESMDQWLAKQGKKKNGQ